MTGRTVIVTGASSGLGFETARSLCEGGNDVIMACRDEEKAKRAIDRIKLQQPNALVTYLHLDLGDLDSVRRFVEDFRGTGKRPSVLINNAGLALNFNDTKPQLTKDNFELTIGTNHLGHFLLTNLLIDDLKSSAAESGDVRVIILTSSLHDPSVSKRTKNLKPIDLDDLFLFKDDSYTGLQAYKNSKAANLLFAYELARRLEGTGVRVNAICPGIVPGTDLMRHASAAQKLYARYFLHGIFRFVKLTRTVSQAAASICALATEDKFKEVSGKYFVDGVEAASSEETRNGGDLQAKLWDLSGRYTGLDGYEPLSFSVPTKATQSDPENEKEKTDKEEEDVINKDGDGGKQAQQGEPEIEAA